MTVERQVTFLGLTFKFLEAEPGRVDKLQRKEIEIVSKDALVVRDSPTSSPTVYEKGEINEADIRLRHRGKEVRYFWNPTEVK